MSEIAIVPPWVKVWGLGHFKCNYALCVCVWGGGLSPCQIEKSIKVKLYKLVLQIGTHNK